VPSRDDFCPVAKATETLGDRWSLLLVRELLRGVGRFNELERSVPGISRSVLAQRLRQLERAGIVTRETAAGTAGEYALTPSGLELGDVVRAFNDWGVRWRVPHPRSGQIDPDGLMLWIRRHVLLDALPARRVVIGFALGRGRGTRRYWLVLRPDEVSLCPDHPGFPEDLLIAADVAALYRLLLGTLTLEDARDRGLVRVEGPPALIRAFPRWFRMAASRPPKPSASGHGRTAGRVAPRVEELP
jgi:DNA-binding HxlR family transcriptional regulator